MKHLPARRLYLALAFISSALFAVAFTAMALYEVQTAGLNPLQLVLVGTVLELAVLVFEVPTGVVADVYSRRLSIIIGHALMGVGFVVEGLLPFFLPILLAQLLWGAGYTFTSGATQAWLSDEIGEEAANRAFLAGNRVEMLGSLAGLAAAIGLAALLPLGGLIVASGAGRVALALLLLALMAETGFHPTRAEDRNTWQHMADILRKGVQTIRSRPALLNILGVGLFYGLYSEGFDRLWVKHLLDQFSLPFLAQNEVAFFSLLRAASLLVSIIVTVWAEKRLDVQQPAAIGRWMSGFTLGIVAALLIFAWAPWLGLALAAYLLLSGLRNIVGPLTDAWVNQRLDADVRATVLSLVGQVDAFGQIAGGPVVGWLAKAVSVSLALSASAALLTPALGLIARANQRIRSEDRLQSPGD
jgi:DHA3 family tetracycline resistance protein-like MFS transporter